MEFWDAVDRFVGYIPVASTVKDAIEAGVAEAKGHHGATKEEVIEAAVIIVSDLVTVTAFGASAEVATAGAIAAEGIFKQAAKGVVPNVAAEATSLGSGRKADDDVTAVAVTQYASEKVVFEEAKGHAAGAAGAAKEVSEAAVIIVSDLVTVTAFGASAEVATAGAIAAEGIFKQAAKGVVPNVAAEATSLGSGRKADDDVTAVAVTQYASEKVVFEEAKGHAAGAAGAAKEVSEAGVIRVSDLVSVAAFGASEDVVEAGNTAVKWFLKHAVKRDEKTTEEAIFLGSGTNAADVVLTAAAASQYARQIILSKKSFRSGKPSSKKLTEEPKRGHRVAQPSKKLPEESKRGDPVAKPSRKPSKEPKRGHHVINNGVIRIIPDIIKGFLEEFKDTIFLGNSYQELVDQNIITLDVTPKLMLMLNQPLPPVVCAQIERMVADTPPGETHTDQNDEAFGGFKLELMKTVWNIIYHVFTSLQQSGGIVPLSEDFLDQMQSLIDLINQNTGPIVGKSEIYVDEQALEWWLAKGDPRQEEQFTTCRDSVKNMFDSLVCEENPYDGIACILGREIFYIHETLIKRYNRQPQLVYLTHNFNPVDFVQNRREKRAPNNAVELGYQKDGVGKTYSLYSAVALSRWGAIPGKVMGNTCWFSYEGKEYHTENFVWLTSMRQLQMKENKGSRPQLAVLCARNGTAWYAAIAKTSWGNIPGKAKDSTCFYSYNGKEYSTDEFCWLVRATPQ